MEKKELKFEELEMVTGGNVEISNREANRGTEINRDISVDPHTSLPGGDTDNNVLPPDIYLREH